LVFLLAYKITPLVKHYITCLTNGVQFKPDAANAFYIIRKHKGIKPEQIGSIFDIECIKT
jgi:hypothetical protein